MAPLGARLCENAHEARMRRIVFSIAYLPIAVASVIGFHIDEIEKDFLRANRTSEFSHSLGHEGKAPLPRLSDRCSWVRRP
jgi:hypothetical protein